MIQLTKDKAIISDDIMEKLKKCNNSYWHKIEILPQGGDVVVVLKTEQWEKDNYIRKFDFFIETKRNNSYIQFPITEFCINTESKEDWYTDFEKTKIKKVKTYYFDYLKIDNQFKRWCDIESEDFIQLSNGTYLMNKFGKYEPNLCFLNRNCPKLFKIRTNWNKFNMSSGSIDVIYGTFFVSKKGTNCFRILPQEEATDILICDSWGGAFSKYRGKAISDKTNGVKYYRCAHSNGGGCGTDYIVVPKDWKYQLSEEDI